MTTYAPDLAHDLFLGRQSILDRSQNLVGYELQFRTAEESRASIEDEVSAAATVFSHLFSELGVEFVLGPYRAFVNVSASLLLSELVEIAPSDRVTLEITGTEAITPAVIARCAQLKAAGYQLAIEGSLLGPSHNSALLSSLALIKVDVSALLPEQLSSVTKALLHCGVPLLASGVATHQQARQCLDLGYAYIQGHYFAEPVTLKGKRLNSSEFAVIRLVGLVLADADVEEIVDIIKHHPDLSLRLLKLVNTAAVGAKVKIHSLEHALLVLGRTQLKRWVQLLLFATGGAVGIVFPSPLLVLAASRGRLMEILAARFHMSDAQMVEKAYLTGMMSLMGAQFGIDLAELLAHFPIDPQVTAALIDRAGTLGSLLFLVEELELPTFDERQFALTKIDASSPADLLRAQLDALRWANSIC